MRMRRVTAIPQQADENPSTSSGRPFDKLRVSGIVRNPLMVSGIVRNPLMVSLSNHHGDPSAGSGESRAGAAPSLAEDVLTDLVGPLAHRLQLGQRNLGRYVTQSAVGVDGQTIGRQYLQRLSDSRRDLVGRLQLQALDVDDAQAEKKRRCWVALEQVEIVVAR